MTGEQWIVGQLEGTAEIMAIVPEIITVAIDEVIAPAIIVRQEGRDRERFFDGSCAEWWHVRVDFYATNYTQYHALGALIETTLDVKPCMLIDETSARMPDSEGLKLPKSDTFPLFHGWQRYKVFGTADELGIESS